jgi:hypothetical protein
MAKRLASKRAARLRVAPPTPQYVDFVSPIPPSVRLEDCEARTIADRTLESYGVLPGDQCLIHKTKEVQSGDLALWRETDEPESTAYLSRFYTSPGGRVRFEHTRDGERRGVVRLAEKIVIIGRVFSVERNGRVARTFEQGGVRGNG